MSISHSALSIIAFQFSFFSISRIFMESNDETSRFDPGCELGVFLACSDLLSETWKASCIAHKSREPFVVHVEGDDRVVIAFKGSSNFGAFEGDEKFGECEIGSAKNGLFGFMEDGALVHHGIFKWFMDIWENPEIQTQVLKALKKKKKIVFTGHSLAGAIASLATLGVLEKFRRKASVFCVTFGCPLIGDDKFGQAIRREGWAAKFCHVVSVHDIVARVLLAPLELICEPMGALLHYWSSKMADGNNDESRNAVVVIPLSNQKIADFYITVLQHVSAVVTYSNPASMMAPAIMVKDSIKSVFNLSPYRPFGNFLFCSESGAVCVENHEAVLQLLYYILENSDASLDLAPKASILEHTQYGSYFTSIQNNRMRSEGLHPNIALPEGRSTYDMCLALQLEALGLGIQNVRAQLALQAAGEVETRLSMNSNKQVVELSKAQRVMAEIEWYKKRCKDDGIGYYDSFKLHKDRKDFRANLNRKRLALFWDDIIQMVENHELPEDFQCRTKWIYSATAYRQLVEPLDIANYYRLGKHEVSGHYLSSGRPRRYQILEKWLEDKRKSEKEERKPRINPASLTQDSCFWAYLEEMCHSFENSTDSMPKLKEFENRVKYMINAQELSTEVFLDNSSFMMWWKNQLPAEYKSNCPLFTLMEGGWKLYSKLV